MPVWDTEPRRSAAESSHARGKKRDRSGRVQIREGQLQNREGREQNQDRKGRDQDRVGRHSRDQMAAVNKRAWGNSGRSNNRDNSRADMANDQDNPYERYVQTWNLRRSAPTETLKSFKDSPEPLLPQPCRLCEKTFPCREDFIAHVDAEHGGLQRYRNAFFSLASLLPHVVRGQEWRMVLGNFTEFISRAAKDWENFTPEMREALSSEDGLLPS